MVAGTSSMLDNKLVFCPVFGDQNVILGMSVVRLRYLLLSLVADHGSVGYGCLSSSWAS